MHLYKFIQILIRYSVLLRQSTNQQLTLIMGGGESKTEEHKTIDTDGTVNNNLVFNQEKPVDIHNKEIIILLSIICAIKLIQLGVYLYVNHRRSLKKKYASGQNNSHV